MIDLLLASFLVAQRLKHLPGMRETLGFHPWVRKIPWRRKWQPTPVLLPGESHGGRSLVGYSPWGCKDSDTTERLHFLSLSFLGVKTARGGNLWQPHFPQISAFNKGRSKAGSFYIC